MVLPKTLYVREDAQRDEVVYVADPEPMLVRDGDDAPNVQVLGVYQLVGTVETRVALEVSEVKKAK
jgi:hypothetical protein